MLKGPPSPSTGETPALGTSLATVRRVGPNQVPIQQRALPMAPSAACHSQWPRHPTLRTPPPGLPTFGARRPSLPTVERCDEWCCRSPWPLSADRFHWHPLRSRKMMPLSICRGSERLRPRALGGSSSRMIGSIRSAKARPVLPRWSLASLVSPCGPSRCFWRNHTNRPRNRSMHLWFRF